MATKNRDHDQVTYHLAKKIADEVLKEIKCAYQNPYWWDGEGYLHVWIDTDGTVQLQATTNNGYATDSSSPSACPITQPMSFAFSWLNGRSDSGGGLTMLPSATLLPKVEEHPESPYVCLKQRVGSVGRQAKMPSPSIMFVG